MIWGLKVKNLLNWTEHRFHQLNVIFFVATMLPWKVTITIYFRKKWAKLLVVKIVFFQLVKKCKQVLLDLFHISQGLLINRVIGQSNSLKWRLDIYGRQIQLSIPIIFFQNTEWNTRERVQPFIKIKFKTIENHCTNYFIRS